MGANSMWGRMSDIDKELSTGNVRALNARWYRKVSETHVAMFALIVKLIEALDNRHDEKHLKLAKKILAHECALTGYDAYVSSTGASYTLIITEVRREFSAMARCVEGLLQSVKDKKILEIVRAIHEVSCAEANADCFKSLLNGYRKSMALRCNDEKE